MIMQICLAIGVLEISGIYDIRKNCRTFDIQLICDVSNPLVSPMRQEVATMAELLPQDNQTNVAATTEAIEIGVRNETTPIDAMSIFNAQC